MARRPSTTNNRVKHGHKLPTQTALSSHINRTRGRNLVGIHQIAPTTHLSTPEGWKADAEPISDIFKYRQVNNENIENSVRYSPSGPVRWVTFETGQLSLIKLTGRLCLALIETISVIKTSPPWCDTARNTKRLTSHDHWHIKAAW